MKIVRKPNSDPPPGSWQPDRPVHLRDTWPDVRVEGRGRLHRFKLMLLRLVGAMVLGG